MKTLLIQYQIGQCAPSWYPLWSDVEITDAEAQEIMARERAGNGAFRNILTHRIVDDGLTPEQDDARYRAMERAERRCDPGYVHDVRFGDGA